MQEEVFYGHQGLVHLTNSTEYKNGTSVSIYKIGYSWRQNGPYMSESSKHVHVTILLEKLWCCDVVWILLDCIKGDELFWL